jgi:hypothetical protein
MKQRHIAERWSPGAIQLFSLNRNNKSMCVNLPFRMNKHMGMKLPKLCDTVFDIARIVQ